MTLLLEQLLNGLQFGAMLFMLASGLTLIFGIMGVVNLTHGSFYMVGAYCAAFALAHTGSFAAAALAARLGAGAYGLLIEFTVIRRLYQRDHLYQVLATFGLILFTNEAVSLLFGRRPPLVDMPAVLQGAVPLAPGFEYPVARLAFIVIGALVALGLWWLVNRTRVGMLVRAGADDREMVSALGIDIRKLYTLVFGLGAVRSGRRDGRTVAGGGDRHGRARADHYFRGHRHRRRRVGARRARGRAARGHGRQSRTGLPAAGAGEPADTRGRDAAGRQPCVSLHLSADGPGVDRSSARAVLVEVLNHVYPLSKKHSDVCNALTASRFARLPFSAHLGRARGPLPAGAGAHRRRGVGHALCDQPGHALPDLRVGSRIARPGVGLWRDGQLRPCDVLRRGRLRCGHRGTPCAGGRACVRLERVDAGAGGLAPGAGLLRPAGRGGRVPGAAHAWRAVHHDHAGLRATGVFRADVAAGLRRRRRPADVAAQCGAGARSGRSRGVLLPVPRPAGRLDLPVRARRRLAIRHGAAGVAPERAPCRQPGR